MGSKKHEPAPYLIDDDNRPLTDEEIKGLMPAEQFFAKYGHFKDSPAPSGQSEVTLRLDNEVLAYFDTQSKDWQARINSELASVVRERKKAS
jgi:uncharacterized protein (DUF4415 family)